MRWIGISGTGAQDTHTDIEGNVRSDVAAILKRGDGIVTGGSLGVDWFATDEALKHDPKAKRIKVFIPTTLAQYEKHIDERIAKGISTEERKRVLLDQLRTLRQANPEALVETHGVGEVTLEAYYNRNTKVVEASDELHAFQVNGSAGTQNTIDKARAAGIPIVVKKYTAA